MSIHTLPKSKNTKLPSHGHVSFDPSIHLAYQEPEERFSMSELGLDHVNAPSQIGVTSPFSLASLEGVKAMRRDILQPSVVDNYMTFSALSGPHFQLRGMAPEAARFVYDFWTSPAVLQAVSQAAGEDLVPVFDYELGHTNIQVPSGMDRKEYVRSLSEDPYNKDAPAMQAPNKGEKPSLVIGYHHDAYPWVCVLMLSDVAGMVGGETEIIKGDGTKIRAIGPEIGSCVMMQGGYIEHCALPCHGARERVTMVTSFRPRCKIVRDVSNLTNIRAAANLYEVYDQFVNSRLDILQETIDLYRERLKSRRGNIEDAYGRRGGLKRPTVNLSEMQAILNVVNETISNTVAQLPPYGTDPLDKFTPKLVEDVSLTDDIIVLPYQSKMQTEAVLPLYNDIPVST